jgi:uncharacterized membrane protein YozB (DUF420 family)
MTVTDLPPVNATLNAVSTVLLLLGWRFIHRGRRDAHRNCMVAAFVTSSLFLACYLTYHFQMQKLYGRAHTSFTDPAWFRPIYLALLATHLLGAFAILPLIGVTFFYAIKERFDSHKRIARWTLPVWLYVSVTGVVIYLLLYQVFPQPK